MTDERTAMPEPGGYMRDHVATFGAGTLRGLCPPHEWKSWTVGEETITRCRKCNRPRFTEAR